MPVSSAVIVGGLLLVVGAGLIIAALFQRMHAEPRYCRGSLVPWWWRVVFLPGWFLRWGSCRYDLSHLARDPASGAARCPECGFTVKPTTRLWHSTALLRIGRLGICFALASPITWFILVDGSVKRDMVRATPTWVLVYAEDVFGTALPAFPRDELRRRLRHWNLTSWERRAAARIFSRDLQDDDQRRNAARAFRWYSLQEVDLALEELTPHLDSEDWQTRHLAADLLRELNVEPFPRLLEVTLEGLHGDDQPGNLRAYRSYQNRYEIRHAFRYFIQHPEASRPYVEQGIRSSDVQQRFLCTIAATFAPYDDLADMVMPILLIHLRNNEVRGDAGWASGALLQWGESAVPYLEEVELMNDEQARQIATHLLWRLSPPNERATGRPPLPRRADVIDLDRFNPMNNYAPWF